MDVGPQQPRRIPVRDAALLAALQQLLGESLAAGGAVVGSCVTGHADSMAAVVHRNMELFVTR